MCGRAVLPENEASCGKGDLRGRHHRRAARDGRAAGLPHGHSRRARYQGNRYGPISATDLRKRYHMSHFVYCPPLRQASLGCKGEGERLFRRHRGPLFEKLSQRLVAKSLP